MKGCGGCLGWIIIGFIAMMIFGLANTKHPEQLGMIMPPELVENVADLQRIQMQEVQKATYYRSPTPTPTRAAPR